MVKEASPIESAGSWTSWLSWGGSAQPGKEKEERTRDTAEGSESKEEEEAKFVVPSEQEQHRGPPLDFTHRSLHINLKYVDEAVVDEGTVEGLLEDYKLLMFDARLLLAEDLWEKIEGWLAGEGAQGEVGQRVRAEVEGEEVVGMVARMRERCRLAREAVAQVDDEGEWTFASSNSGTDTYYRPGEQGELHVKMSSAIDDCLIFHLMCVLREADLFQKWAPLINKSFKLKEIRKESLVVWYTIHLPFVFTREVVMQISAVEDLDRRTIICYGTSLNEQNVPKGVVLPPEPRGFNAKRMNVSDFKLVIRLTSATCCRMDVVTTVYPEYPSFQRIINFSVKRWGAYLPLFMERQARKLAKDPVNNMHAKRMRDHPLYYDHYIRRAAKVCMDLDWPVPTPVAFDVAGDDSIGSKVWRQVKQEVEEWEASKTPPTTSSSSDGSDSN